MSSENLTKYNVSQVDPFTYSLSVDPEFGGELPNNVPSQNVLIHDGGNKFIEAFGRRSDNQFLIEQVLATSEPLSAIPVIPNNSSLVSTPTATVLNRQEGQQLVLCVGDSNGTSAYSQPFLGDFDKDDYTDPTILELTAGNGPFGPNNDDWSFKIAKGPLSHGSGHDDSLNDEFNVVEWPIIFAKALKRMGIPNPVIYTQCISGIGINGFSYINADPTLTKHLAACKWFLEQNPANTILCVVPFCGTNEALGFGGWTEDAAAFEAAIDAYIPAHRAAMTVIDPQSRDYSRLPYIWPGVTQSFITGGNTNAPLFESVLADTPNRHGHTAHANSVGVSEANGLHYDKEGYKTFGNEKFPAALLAAHANFTEILLSNAPDYNISLSQAMSVTTSLPTVTVTTAGETGHTTNIVAPLSVTSALPASIEVETVGAAPIVIVNSEWQQAYRKSTGQTIDASGNISSWASQGTVATAATQASYGGGSILLGLPAEDSGTAVSTGGTNLNAGTQSPRGILKAGVSGLSTPTDETLIIDFEITDASPDGIITGNSGSAKCIRYEGGVLSLGMWGAESVTVALAQGRHQLIYTATRSNARIDLDKVTILDTNSPNLATLASAGTTDFLNGPSGSSVHVVGADIYQNASQNFVGHKTHNWFYRINGGQLSKPESDAIADELAGS